MYGKIEVFFKIAYTTLTDGRAQTANEVNFTFLSDLSHHVLFR